MSPPAICCGTTPSLLHTWPANAGDAELQPLRSSSVLISLRNQPPIWAPVLPHGRCVDVVVLVELVHQLAPAAASYPRVLLARVQCRTEGPCRRRRPDPCRHSRCRPSGPSRPCRSARRRAPAGRARSRRRRRGGSGTCCRSPRLNVLREDLARAVERVERLRESSTPCAISAPASTAAMAGAASALTDATPAVPTRGGTQEFAALHVSPPRNGFCLPSRIPLSGISVPPPRTTGQTKSPAKRGFSMHGRHPGRRAPG